MRASTPEGSRLRKVSEPPKRESVAQGERAAQARERGARELHAHARPAGFSESMASGPALLKGSHPGFQNRRRPFSPRRGRLNQAGQEIAQSKTRPQSAIQAAWDPTAQPTGAQDPGRLSTRSGLPLAAARRLSALTPLGRRPGPRVRFCAKMPRGARLRPSLETQLTPRRSAVTIGQPNSAPRSGAWRRVLWLGAFRALAACQSSPAPSNAPGDVDGASAEAGGKTAPGAAQAAIPKKDSPTAQANETPAADGQAYESMREKVKDQSEGPIDVESIAREMCMDDMDSLEKNLGGKDLALALCDCFGQEAKKAVEKNDFERLAVEKARIKGKKAAGKKLTQEETEFERSYDDKLAEINGQIIEACLNR